MDLNKIDIYNSRDIKKKAFVSLLGICHGLIADNKLNEQEFFYLRQWLLENETHLCDWPSNLIMKHINEILDDSIVTEEELNHMRDILANLIGGTLEDTGSTSGNSTSLPLTPNATIRFDGTSFCFTGQLIYGPRKKCQEVTLLKGGAILSDVRTDLHYLVIGEIASTSWANTSYGRKIEKAIKFQESGHNIAIINEESWVKALQN